MYVTTSQLILSLERLKDLHPFFGFAFLAFKKADLPIGVTERISYNVISELVLNPYFRPLPAYDGYFNPFKSNKTWVSSRYDSTSLQRIVADTFSDAFIYEKGSGKRGWKTEYIAVLRSLMDRLKSDPIPILDLAVWLYRNDGKIPNEAEAVEYLTNKVISEFSLTPTEIDVLCLAQRGRAVSVTAEAPDLNDVWNVVGWPEGFRDEGGVILEHLVLTDVGPARELGYFPKERLNILTGDNSLGKTFLLDCAWWAATGDWWRHEAEPRRTAVSRRAEISYGLKSYSGRTLLAEATYNRLDEDWQRPIDQHEGIAVYATHSGAFALWDPIRSPHESNLFAEWSSHLILNRDQVWEGLKREDPRGRSFQVSNGLIQDWATWQASPAKFEFVLRAFERCMQELSPPEGPVLRPGTLTRITGDSREFPTIKMPYGEVPVVYASAGVQRMLALAYVLVWHWTEHLHRCIRAKRSPFKRMILLIDEIEAHLHPRWQRQILPALLKTLKVLSPDLRIQVHVSTHSPLVLASLEPEFSPSADAIHHLTLRGEDVDLEEVEAVKHGTVDAWLESEIFGLSSARSLAAELAIEKAKALQLAPRPRQRDIREAHQQLVRTLPDDDPFWVRWLYFAEAQGGVEGPTRDSSRSRS